jgi:ferredoxin-NADP reductase
MTSLTLLLWIASGLVVQLVIYLGIGFWRNSLEYRNLRNLTAQMNLPVETESANQNDDISIAAWQGFRTFKVDRKIMEDAAQSVCSLYLVPEDDAPLPTFLPGQFLTFRLDVPTNGAASEKPGGAAEQIVRCYSLSDAPSPAHYRISVKRVLPPTGRDVPPGRSSSFIHDQLAIGSRLQVRAPAGHFHIDRSNAPVVLIAGGIGITPLLSMLNWSLAEQPGREIWLFYGVRNASEAVMTAHLEALATAHANFHLRFCWSDALPVDVAGRDMYRCGRINVDLLRVELPLKPYHFYICGPTPMMASLVPALGDWGVPDDRIHFEAFGPASIQRKQEAANAVANTVADPVATSPGSASETAIVVTFAKSGKQFPWQPAKGTLLEFAEANGISVDSGCRAGSCGTCQTTIREGEVGYRQQPDYDPDPGSCLICCCAPKTSVTLEA